MTLIESLQAMRGFLNTLRVELIGVDVSVTTIYLSAVRTDAYQNELGEKAARIQAAIPEQAADRIIMAAAKRSREAVHSLEGKLLLFSHRLAPSLTEKLLAGPSANYARDK